jgi:hypothetical protein
MADGAEVRMNKYTLYWDITPIIDAECGLTISPFEIKLQGNRLAITANAAAGDERQVREQADLVTRCLARSLSYEHKQRYEVVYTGDLVILPNGQRRLSATAQIITKSGLSAAVGVRDVEREREAVRQRAADLTRRATLDPNLRDMLDQWSRYVADPDGRLRRFMMSFRSLNDCTATARRLHRHST